MPSFNEDLISIFNTLAAEALTRQNNAQEIVQYTKKVDNINPINEYKILISGFFELRQRNNLPT